MLAKNETQNADFPLKEICVYTPYYCEENIWKLCEYLRDSKSSLFNKCYAVYVTSELKRTPLWCQKAGMGANKFVLWDYHVFLVSKDGDNSQIYDFDTTLDIPCSFPKYVHQAIQSEETFNVGYTRIFRIIPANVYLTSFASDRSHMLNKTGQYHQPPPEYPPITCAGTTNNFNEFISHNPKVGIGTVVNLEGFLKFFKS